MNYQPSTASKLLVCWATVALMFGPAVGQMSDAETTANLNLRSGPGTGYSVTVVIPGGATVQVRSCEGGWCQVRYGESDGFASRRYLDIKRGSGVTSRWFSGKPLLWFGRIAVMILFPLTLVVGVVRSPGAFIQMEMQLQVFAVAAFIVLPATIWGTVILGPEYIASSETLKGIAAVFGLIDFAVILRWVYLGFREMSAGFGVALLIFMSFVMALARSVSYLEVIGISVLVLAINFTDMLEDAAMRMKM